MKKGRASNTAQYVALNRALGNIYPEVNGFSDPVAENFLRSSWKKLVDRKRANHDVAPYPFWMSHGMAVFNQFRTVVLDHAIESAPPFRQLVILGAGLDSRAYRIECLKDVVVYEVDHPATQSMKLKLVSALDHKAGIVHHVAVDFKNEDILYELKKSGFDPCQSTFWLWEGVTMYLEPEDVTGTLEDINLVSVGESRVALTYMEKCSRNWHERLSLKLFGKLTGEPLLSEFEPGEFNAMATGTGWQTISDTGILDWQNSYAPGISLNKSKVGFQWHERIWIGKPF